MVRARETFPYRVDEHSIALKPQLARFVIKRRVVRDERELVMDQRANRFRQKFDPTPQAFVASAEPVKPDAEPIIQLMSCSALQPCPKRICQNRGLGGAGLSRERLQLLREVVGQVELVAGLECLHR